MLHPAPGLQGKERARSLSASSLFLHSAHDAIAVPCSCRHSHHTSRTRIKHTHLRRCWSEFHQTRGEGAAAAGSDERLELTRSPRSLVCVCWLDQIVAALGVAYLGQRTEGGEGHAGWSGDRRVSQRLNSSSSCRVAAVRRCAAVLLCSTAAMSSGTPAAVPAAAAAAPSAPVRKSEGTPNPERIFTLAQLAEYDGQRRRRSAATRPTPGGNRA